MAINTRLKRQSVYSFLSPSNLIGVFPSDSGIVQDEWQAAAWIYSGTSVALEEEGSEVKGLMELSTGQILT